jgi:hypothetical protein
MRLGASLANAAWWATGAPSAVAFEAALADPTRSQERVLTGLLRRNAGTAYGREHGFAEIRTPEQFARRVPPVDYDAIRPWVERVRRGEGNVLSAEPVRRLVPTSGSTAARKLIPYTASMQAELNRAIGPWVFDLYRRHPGAARGPAYWSVTPVAENLDAVGAKESTAVPIGFDDDAEYLGGWRKHFVAAAMAVPSSVASIPSVEDWRYVTLLHLLRRRDLALVSVWHPSFFELLLRAMAREWESLVRDVARGRSARAERQPAAAEWWPEARPMRRRAEELWRLGPFDIGRIWPRLAVVSCWADGHAVGAAEALGRVAGRAEVQPKGLLATEGVVSIPYAGRWPLAVRSHFLEFEDRAGRVRTAADLRDGEQYSVLLTTGGGLYRYRLHDLVRVDGRLGSTPSVRFVGKTASVSDRVGEKLADSFVAEILATLFSSGARPSFALLAPEAEGGVWRYVLYVDTRVGPALAAQLDEMLARNPQYGYCRRIGQLLQAGAVQVSANAYERYVDRLRATGQRLGDIKPAALSPLTGWSETLGAGHLT